jgi:hypothetical protein
MIASLEFVTTKWQVAYRKANTGKSPNKNHRL